MMLHLVATHQGAKVIFFGDYGDKGNLFLIAGAVVAPFCESTYSDRDYLVFYGILHDSYLQKTRSRGLAAVVIIWAYGTR